MPELTNIPKVKAVISDGNLRIQRRGATPKITILGVTDSTNSNITLMNPIQVEDDADVNMFDLASGKPSEITKAVTEVMAAGGDNVEVVVLAANSGTSYPNLTRYTDLDSAYTALLNHDVQIILPVEAHIDSPNLFAATRNFGYQLANFCRQATK